MRKTERTSRRKRQTSAQLLPWRARIKRARNEIAAVVCENRSSAFPYQGCRKPFASCWTPERQSV